MSLKTVYIISLKFAPGLKKEFEVLGENIRRKGINVKYVISDKYSNLEGKTRDVDYIETTEGIKGIIFDTLKLYDGKIFIKIFSSQTPFFICFYNPHPLNPRIAKLLKKYYPNAILSLYLHDPYKPDKSPYGIVKGMYFSFAEFIQGLTLRYMDYVVSPSENSSNLFKRKYPTFKGKNYIAPLLVPDKRISTKKEKKLFSIVGAAHRATGHDIFIDLINYVAEKRLKYQFALISSKNITNYIDKLTIQARNYLKIVNKKIILDSEIDDIIRQSYAVFRLDREVTQSGVIPVAYMNETPIIARDILGLKQHVKHEYNGFIVPFNCSMEKLIESMNFVKENYNKLSRNARKSYEEIWAEWNFNKYYNWLINLLLTSH